MASRGGGCLRPCPCPHAGTLGRPDRSSCGGLPANLDLGGRSVNTPTTWDFTRPGR
jgi:hypothetical protein